MKKEIWVPVYGWHRYLVSDRGNVKTMFGTGRGGGERLTTPKLMSPQINKNGYLYIMLYGNGKKRNIQVHRLVAANFLSRSEKLHVAHLDGNKTNNAFENLTWCTAAENNEHKRRHGTLLMGDKIKNAKIDEFTAKRILRFRQWYGLRLVDIAKKLNLPVGIITKICRRETWKHINISS